MQDELEALKARGGRLEQPGKVGGVGLAECNALLEQNLVRRQEAEQERTPAGKASLREPEIV
jgi:hypothetical protein